MTDRGIPAIFSSSFFGWVIRVQGTRCQASRFYLKVLGMESVCLSPLPHRYVWLIIYFTSCRYASSAYRPLSLFLGSFCPTLGIGFFFSAFMLCLTAIQARYTAFSPKSSEEFSTASRSVKPGLIASGIVSAWTWAATLVSPFYCHRARNEGLTKSLGIVAKQRGCIQVR